jgi:DUF5010 C-terminal domain/Kelch motif
MHVSRFVKIVEALEDRRHFTAVPGTIQAEDFNEGGQGVAYNDTTAANLGGNSYRGATRVDLQTSADTGGGVHVSHTKKNEWLKYTIEVAETGAYTFDVRVATGSTGGKMRLEIDGANKGTITLPKTGGLSKFKTISKSGIHLTVGTHTMRVFMAAIGTNSSVGNFNWFRFTAETPPPPSGEIDIQWASGASSPVSRYEAPTALYDGKIYAFGGWSTGSGTNLTATPRVDVYNPANNTWSTRANLPELLTHAPLAVDEATGDAYLIGGAVGGNPGTVSKQIWRYNFAQDQWFDAGFDLPRPLGAGGAVVIGRQLHYFGGFEVQREVNTGDHFAINLDNPAGWQSKDSLPTPRHHFGTVLKDGRIYVFGGETKHDTASPVQQRGAHVYDPATDEWSALALLPNTVSHTESSTFVLNGKIIIAGGLTQTRTAHTQILSYDPLTDTYEEIEDLPAGRIAPIVHVIDGKWIVIGGQIKPGGIQGNTYIGTVV